MSFQKMDPTVKTNWLAALRSGVYKQGKRFLRPTENSYCCLGVLCDISTGTGAWKAMPLDPYLEFDGYSECLPDLVAAFAGLNDRQARSTLMEMNDRGDSFEEIADWIEKNL